MFDRISFRWILCGISQRRGGRSLKKIGLCAINFDANGGACTTTSAKYQLASYAGAEYRLEDENATETTLPSASREGYEFTGWKDGAGTELSKATLVHDNTYYAQWKAKTYMVTFDATGGKVSAANKAVTYQSAYGALPTATRIGYIFTGWYTAANGGKQITEQTVMETPSDHTLYAQWKEDIHPYKVNHFQMNANGSGYTLAETQTLSGRTGQTVSGAVKTYTGFTSPAAANTIVTADDAAHIDYYYSRNKYQLTLSQGTGISSVSQGGTFYYGQSVGVNAVVSSGYSFAAWVQSGYGNVSTNASFNYTMPAGNVTLTATAGPAMVNYRVVHQQMNTDGSTYTVVGTETFTAQAGSNVTPAVKSYTGFTSPGTQTVAVAADGSTTITYSYTRNKYAVTVTKGTGIKSVSGAASYYYGTNATVKATAATDYLFKSWTVGSATVSSSASYTFTVTGAVTVVANSKIDNVIHEIKETEHDGKEVINVPSWAKKVRAWCETACPDCSIAGGYIGGIAIGNTYNSNGAINNIGGCMIENSPTVKMNTGWKTIPSGTTKIYVTGGYWKNNVKCNSHGGHNIKVQFSE